MDEEGRSMHQIQRSLTTVPPEVLTRNLTVAVKLKGPTTWIYHGIRVMTKPEHFVSHRATNVPDQFRIKENTQWQFWELTDSLETKKDPGLTGGGKLYFLVEVSANLVNRSNPSMLIMKKSRSNKPISLFHLSFVCIALGCQLHEITLSHYFW